MPRIRNLAQLENQAILVGRQRNNQGADDTGDNYKPGVWRAGEIVGTFKGTHRFGFQEMPINSFGQRTVAQINAVDVTTIPVYAAVKMLDSGTVTSGTNADVEVVTEDVLVIQVDNSWTNFGDRDEVPDGFFHILIRDKTEEEVKVYLEAFNKKLAYQTDQFNPSDDMRRWTTTNVRVSASGNNGFTAQGIQDVIDNWNAQDPLDPDVQPNPNPITLVDTDNLTYFQCDGIMPVEVFDAWQETTQQFAFGDLFKRRRWYINQAGRNALSANDWVLAGDAADIAPFLRDGLLD